MAGKTMAKRSTVSAGTALVGLRWSRPDADRDQPRQAGKLGGRPKKLKTCPDCGATAGTAEMRSHRCALVV